MEDIEKLCEDLRKASYKYGSCIYGWHYFDEAANAIEELKAENEHIRSNCYPRDGVQAIIDERDRFKAERDAAVKCILAHMLTRAMMCFATARTEEKT